MNQAQNNAQASQNQAQLAQAQIAQSNAQLAKRQATQNQANIAQQQAAQQSNAAQNQAQYEHLSRLAAEGNVEAQRALGGKQVRFAEGDQAS